VVVPGTGPEVAVHDLLLGERFAGLMGEKAELMQEVLEVEWDA
jgi:hypothetical protein